MSLAPQTHLGHYEILALLGSGGMGEVYRARDTQLGREVAIKVLPEAFSKDTERLARFEREARLLASLNHPNIATLYGLEQSGEIRFLVMELVPGETLAEKIARGPIPIDEALPLFRQIAEGLEAAHEKGVIHRDLKPANIKVAPGGKPKILDFGLAKAYGEEASAQNLSESPTAARGTATGVILGTAPYMSPEQARGKVVDKRADVWTFGCCLYEALTGRQAFIGDTVSDTIAVILKNEPDWERLPATTPAQVRSVLGRCLRKDPERRLRDVGDARIEIEEAQEVKPESSGAGARPTRTSLFLVLTALAASAVAALAVWSLMRSGAPGRERAVQVTSAADVENYPTWSPDGGRLAYESNQSGNWDIWVIQLGGGEPVNLTADHSGDDRFPSWSPEGHQIAYLSQTDEVWSLYTLSALGGRPRKLISLAPVDFNPWGAPQWSADGKEIAVSFRSSGRNVADIVSVQSQETRRVVLPAHAENMTLDLSWSPDGRYFTYIDAIFGNAEVTRLWVVSSSGGEPVPVTDGMTNDWNPTWSRDGRNLFFVSNRGGSMDLWRQRIGEDGKPRGEAEPVTTGLEIRTAAFSPHGTRLAYSRGRREYDSNIWRVPILQDRPATWADAEQLTFDNALIQFFDVSPDRRRLALSSNRAGNQDLWILSSRGGEMTQLTTEPTPDWCPRWSPDGKQIAFYAYRSGNRDIWVMPADGGPARQIAPHPAEDIYPTWSPDGREIAFVSRRSGSRDIWIVAADGGEPRQVTTHPDQEETPEYSPDGRWLGFERSGSFYRIPTVGKGEPELVAKGPGDMFRWSRNRRFAYFTGDRERRGRLWALSLKDGSEYPLTGLVGRRGSLSFSLATDGQYLYFHWDEDMADIWVMDVAH